MVLGNLTMQRYIGGEIWMQVITHGESSRRMFGQRADEPPDIDGELSVEGGLHDQVAEKRSDLPQPGREQQLHKKLLNSLQSKHS